LAAGPVAVSGAVVPAASSTAPPSPTVGFTVTPSEGVKQGDTITLAGVTTQCTNQDGTAIAPAVAMGYDMRRISDVLPGIDGPNKSFPLTVAADGSWSLQIPLLFSHAQPYGVRLMLNCYNINQGDLTRGAKTIAVAGPPVTVTAGTVKPGGSLTVTLSGFKAGEQVEVGLYPLWVGPLADQLLWDAYAKAATWTVDATGAYSGTITVPSDFLDANFTEQRLIQADAVYAEIEAKGLASSLVGRASVEVELPFILGRHPEQWPVRTPSPSIDLASAESVHYTLHQGETFSVVSRAVADCLEPSSQPYNETLEVTNYGIDLTTQVVAARQPAQATDWTVPVDIAGLLATLEHGTVPADKGTFFRFEAFCNGYTGMHMNDGSAHVSYWPAGTGLTVGASTVAPGGAVRVTLTGFEPGEKVHVGLYSAYYALAEWTMDANGSYSGTVTLPSTVTPGQHTLQVVGTTSELADAAALTVGDKAIARAPGSATDIPQDFTQAPQQ
jgi:hypothetical protein